MEPKKLMIGAGVVIVVLAVIMLLSQAGNQQNTVVQTSSSTESGLEAGATSGDVAAGVSPAGTAGSGGTASALIGKRAPELSSPSGYTNSDPFLLQSFIGQKVILVDFWTYSSSNSMRTIPYVSQWYEKYHNKGLAIVGVHTPRFAFEKEKDRLDKVILASNIFYPVVLDSQYGTWNSYGVKVWPTQYLIDIDGHVVYAHQGEGDYLAMEAKIQELLVARAKKLKLPNDVYAPFVAPGAAVAVDLAKIKSPETYFGAERNTTLGNGVPRKEGLQDMKPVTDVKSNVLYLTGSWDISKEFAKSAIENDKVIFKYNAKSVAGVFSALKMSKIRITVDGQPLGANAGKDIRIEKGQSYLYVSEAKIYDLIKGADYGEHTIEMVAETPGVQLYALMFG